MVTLDCDEREAERLAALAAKEARELARARGKTDSLAYGVSWHVYERGPLLIMVRQMTLDWVTVRWYDAVVLRACGDRVTCYRGGEWLEYMRWAAR